MAPVDALGYVAASLVLATFCAKKMAPLRALAIASNIAFVAYAFSAGLGPILLLHAVMLPMNILRLREAMSSERALEKERGGSGEAIVGTQIQHPSPVVLRGQLRASRRQFWPAFFRYRHGI